MLAGVRNRGNDHKEMCRIWGFKLTPVKAAAAKRVFATLKRPRLFAADLCP